MWATVAALLPLLLAVKAHNCHGGGKDRIATVATVIENSCPGPAYVYGSSGFVKSATNGSGSFERLPLSLLDDRSTYMFKVKNGLSPGQTVYVSGKTNKKFQAFNVNLLLGKPVLNQGDYVVGTVADHHLNTIALQLRVDNIKMRLFYNYFLDGKKQDDGARADPKAWYNVLHPDRPFDIRIEVNLYGFEIFFNGMRLGDMPHHVPHCAITYVNVDGDVELTRLQIDKKSDKLALQEFETPFPGGHLNIGDRVNVYGRFTDSLFNINFEDAKNDKVFHFNPRKNQDGIVFNTELNHEWNYQKEEFKSGFPFDVKKEFKVEFVNENAGIEIYIDGKYLTTYPHRVNAETDYQKLSFHQDVEVHRIELCRG